MDETLLYYSEPVDMDEIVAHYEELLAKVEAVNAMVNKKDNKKENANRTTVVKPEPDDEFALRIWEKHCPGLHPPFKTKYERRVKNRRS